MNIVELNKNECANVFGGMNIFVPSVAGAFVGAFLGTYIGIYQVGKAVVAEVINQLDHGGKSSVVVNRNFYGSLSNLGHIKLLEHTMYTCCYALIGGAVVGFVGGVIGCV